MFSKIYTAPEINVDSIKYEKSIFLAGTIEMGNSHDWQKEACELIEMQLDQRSFKKICIYNPRRTKWESNLEQSIYNMIFNQQVNWELDCLDKSTHIIMYFDKNSKSPISLLELGLFAKSGKLHVICPEGFYRKGNIDIVCNNYRIPQYESLKELTHKIIYG
mgnify:CR=1 FL=1